jgi:hypothetical protein
MGILVWFEYPNHGPVDPVVSMVRVSTIYYIVILARQATSMGLRGREGGRILYLVACGLSLVCLFRMVVLSCLVLCVPK